MKKRILTAVFIMVAFFMTACGNDDNEDASKKLNENKTVESKEVLSPMDDMKNKLEQLNYSTVDFEVLYFDSEFEGEIREEDGLVEAEFYDPFNSIDARGPDAFDAMFPIVHDLEINPDMKDDEAISSSINSFNIPKEFLKAELQITFSDGTEKTFKITNNEL
ncbi:YusW family protein [Oceanobacillus bengalensis]|uniref:YusW-like protein n=1 Tax=Oceanobacillus bengalensis TaxID=1435466 RepID=A0A494YZA4_9BACI|nr:YusW family protein [Oceanobacillus bengalensis]RKQ15521.1 hypothetical protein D8M05_09630 [Oceanobacillus bengalensis]